MPAPYINGIKKIEESKGDYIVLVYYGLEGIKVMCQTHTVKDALAEIAENELGSPVCLVKLVRVVAQDEDYV